jgi:hypothetical protein
MKLETMATRPCLERKSVTRECGLVLTRPGRRAVS